MFTLDTDFLFAETYELIDKIEKKYGIRVERVKSLYTPEQQAAKFAPKLWTIDPNQCCSLRKVEPLKAKLAGLSAWVTGIRRDQAPTRANAKKIEWDEIVWPGEMQSAGRLDLGKSLGICPRARRALQPTARAELSEHRLCAMHAPGAARRRSARGALVGLREKRVRPARAGVGEEVEVAGCRLQVAGWQTSMECREL